VCAFTDSWSSWEPSSRDRFLEAGHLPEPALAGRDPDGRHGRAGREVEAGLESVDVRIDEPPAIGDRRREPLVTVLDEESVIDLEQRDRHVDHRGLCRAGSDLLTKSSIPGPEAAIEIGHAAD
jgi:hypothetical protein